MGVDLLVNMLMTFNAVIAVLWALAALRVARQESPFHWPVPWRWIVFAWMGTKAGLFVALDVALWFRLSPVIAAGIVIVFTYSHLWAFWRWRQLPESPADETEQRSRR